MPARQLHCDVGVEQAESLVRDHRGAGARAAGRRLADPALEDTQVDAVAPRDAHEAHVGALREAHVALDFRPQPIDRGRGNVVDLQDAVRIAHRYGAHVVLHAVHIECVAILAAFGDERDTRRLEFGTSHADRHELIIDASLDRAGRTQ